MPTEQPQTSTPLLDVRGLPPADRHAQIFDLLGRLEGGEAMILVNDHDPQPLHHRLEWIKPGAFSWDYLAEGPEVWQVRIGRKAGCDCCCGSH